MKIVFVHADSKEEWNSSEWRCAIPARAINRTKRHQASLVNIIDFGKNTPEVQELCAAADVIVVERNLFGGVLSAIQYWKARDKVVLANFDDAYDLMPESNLNYPFWGNGIIQTTGEKMNPMPLTQFKWGLRMVHAALVPSRRLVEDWQSYTKMVYLPNYIELDHYQNIRPESHKGIIIGWGGSISHLQSFMDSGVLQALRNVCRMRPEVKVMICGNDLRITHNLGLPRKQMILQPWVSYREWPRVLSRFDIGLAPLAGAYDERRSWIKVLEYLVMKIPWIASEGSPYHEFRKYGIFVKNTTQAWEQAILDVVDHLVKYKEEASREAYLAGISLGIDDNIEKVLDTFTSIYQDVLGRPIAVSGA
ncbi:MAG: hypothetical protein ACPL3P_07785 [Anaerolineales bacterium]